MWSLLISVIFLQPHDSTVALCTSWGRHEPVKAPVLRCGRGGSRKVSGHPRTSPAPFGTVSYIYPVSLWLCHSSVSHGSLHRGAWLPVSKCCTPWVPCLSPL